MTAAAHSISSLGQGWERKNLPPVRGLPIGYSASSSSSSSSPILPRTNFPKNFPLLLSMDPVNPIHPDQKQPPHPHVPASLFRYQPEKKKTKKNIKKRPN